MIESEFEREFRERLDSGKLTPPGVRALNIHMHPLIDDSNVRVDALAEFSFERIPNRVIKAVIELKSRLTPMALEGAIHQVIGYRNQLRKSSEFDDVYPMLAAPYISESVQRRCQEVGVGYIDLNGTFSIIHKDVYIDVVRPAIEFKNPQGIGNIFAGRSRRVLRVLLANPYVPFRLEDLASKAAVSVGQVFQVTKRLQEQGYLERTSKGRCIDRPRKLLRQFAQELTRNSSLRCPETRSWRSLFFALSSGPKAHEATQQKLWEDSGSGSLPSRVNHGVGSRTGAPM